VRSLVDELVDRVDELDPAVAERLRARLDESRERRRVGERVSTTEELSPAQLAEFERAELIRRRREAAAEAEATRRAEAEATAREAERDAVALARRSAGVPQRTGEDIRAERAAQEAEDDQYHQAQATIARIDRRRAMRRRALEEEARADAMARTVGQRARAQALGPHQLPSQVPDPTRRPDRGHPLGQTRSPAALLGRRLAQARDEAYRIEWGRAIAVIVVIWGNAMVLVGSTKGSPFDRRAPPESCGRRCEPRMEGDSLIGKIWLV
jgi:hypothetical protein